MMKRIATLFFAFSLLFSVTAPLLDTVDAKPRYRSPSKSISPTTPSKTPPTNNNNINDGTNRTGTGTTKPGTAPRTGFGGGGLMRGLMLGGLAGLMFGGLLSGLGAFGSILGLLVNVLAIYILFVLIRKAFRAFSDRNRPRGDYR
jgi:predicted lipid-binding transport protein (Tim44 family)